MLLLRRASPRTTVDASAGGGMVKVTARGDMQITSIKIDPEAIDPEDVEMLEDMIMAAVNEAIRGINDVANRQMGAITGGLNIPGMPFLALGFLMAGPLCGMPGPVYIPFLGLRAKAGAQHRAAPPASS